MNLAFLRERRWQLALVLMVTFFVRSMNPTKKVTSSSPWC